VSADEVKLLSAIETLLGKLLMREVVTDFIPKHSVRLTRLVKARPKKPKKTKQEQSLPQVNLQEPTGDRKSIHRKPRKGGEGQEEKFPGKAHGRLHQRGKSNPGATTITRSKSNKKGSGGEVFPFVQTPQK
jgi:ATP-dependent RNA helicase RhlE